jgi:acyl-CoA thioesterase-1
MLLLAALALIAVEARAETKIVALGASNVKGWPNSREEAFPAQLETRLRKLGYAVRVANAGVNWDSSGDMLARLDTAAPPGTPMVILAENVRFWTNGYMPEIEGRLRKRGTQVLRVNFRSLPRRYVFIDGIHLTAAGHAYFAETLVPQVIPMLRQRAHPRKR